LFFFAHKHYKDKLTISNYIIYRYTTRRS